MTEWFVHLRDDGSIASAHQEMQPDYAEEARDDAKDAELIAFLDAARAPAEPPINPRRIAAIEAALIEKGVIAKGDIDAKEGAREAAVGRM